jgi:hypothetical protein
MWKMANFRRKRRGFALIFVMLIAVAMIIPAMILASNAVSRRRTVTGEAISDRVLTIADSTIDKILNKINTFPFTFTTPTIIDENGDLDEATKEAQDYLISYYLSQLNGGVPDINNPVDSYNTISNKVSTYIYNLQTQEYYAVWDTTNHKIASVTNVGPDGDIKNNTLKNLKTGELLNGGMESNFPNYKKDNLWVEIDTNTQYWPGTPDEWQIRVTSYLLSKPAIKRTIEAIASRGKIESTAGELANGNWYKRSETDQNKTVYYSDFSGLYHTKVYFGKYETTKGSIRSDSNIYMGGWAEDPVYANGRVYDYAVDDHWRSDGRFGPDRERLSWAKNNGYAFDGYPKASWPDGDTALFGSSPVRDPTDPSGGLQDKAVEPYYVNGDATVVFSVVTDADGNKVGKVTINGTTYDMPANGAIFVEGNATVSGTVKGRCSVGASHKIYIGGNILYNNPPRIDKDTPIPAGYIPDALGLIAHNDILIPAETFDQYHHLEIDAAMLSVSGSFGIGEGYSWHFIDGSGDYEAWWNGCQAVWNTSNAPAKVSGRWVKGYDVQHTNYDWNLYNFGPPPFYPPTNSRTEVAHEVRYIIVTDASILDYLRNLTKDQLTSIDPSASDYNPDYPYKYTYNGITYYYGTHFDFGTTAHMKNTQLYRLSWKEQIAKPVKP